MLQIEAPASEHSWPNNSRKSHTSLTYGRTCTKYQFLLNRVNFKGTFRKGLIKDCLKVSSWFLVQIWKSGKSLSQIWFGGPSPHPLVSTTIFNHFICHLNTAFRQCNTGKTEDSLHIPPLFQCSQVSSFYTVQTVPAWRPGWWQAMD